MKKQLNLMTLLRVFAFWILCSSCSDSNDGIALQAQFDIQPIEGKANRFIITNTTQGNYSLSEWDLGNGITSENQKQVEAYYPQKGEYTITLDVWENGVHSKASEQYVIEEHAVSIDFAIEESADNPYLYTITKESDLEEFTWHIETVGSIENQESVTFYYGEKGNCNIVLETVLEGQRVSVSKTISNNIADPNFWSKASLSWSDEFDGTELNSENWTFETGSHGWGNNEWQNYTNGQNATVSNNKLKIIAKKIGSGQKVGDYTSSRIISKGKQSFTYGRFEIKAKLPADKGNGIWPAIWMLGENIDSKGWSACGEIDIMEYVSFQPNTVHSAIHTPSSSGNTINTSGDVDLPTCEEEFHTYGVLWDSNAIKFYIDEIDNIIYTYAPSVKNDENWPFYKPQFLLFNIAVGGNWGGAQGVDDSIFPATMEIDYVRVYQHNIEFKN